MDATTKRHNVISRDAFYRIVQPVIDAGGTTSEILVILESVVAGVLTTCAHIDGQDAGKRDTMLIALEDGVRQRLETIPIPGARKK